MIHAALKGKEAVGPSGGSNRTTQMHSSSPLTSIVQFSIYSDRYIEQKTRDPESFLPLKPHWFHVLMALADQERHGYAIMQEVLERTNGKVTLWPATLEAPATTAAAQKSSTASPGQIHQNVAPSALISSRALSSHSWCLPRMGKPGQDDGPGGEDQAGSDDQDRHRRDELDHARRVEAPANAAFRPIRAVAAQQEGRAGRAHGEEGAEQQQQPGRLQGPGITAIDSERPRWPDYTWAGVTSRDNPQ